jgi:hypothetical protein
MPQLCKANKLIGSPIIFIHVGRFSQWTSEQGPAHPALQKSLPQVSLPGPPRRTVHCKDTIPKIRNKYPRKGTVRPQSQFLHSCVCDRFIYSHDWSAYSAAGKYVYIYIYLQHKA